MSPRLAPFLLGLAPPRLRGRPSTSARRRCPTGAAPPRRCGRRRARGEAPLVVLGLDGGDWQLFDRLMAEEDAEPPAGRRRAPLRARASIRRSRRCSGRRSSPASRRSSTAFSTSVASIPSAVSASRSGARSGEPQRSGTSPPGPASGARSSASGPPTRPSRSTACSSPIASSASSTSKPLRRRARSTRPNGRRPRSKPCDGPNGRWTSPSCGASFRT
jgi:hypothetical protein